MSLYPSQPTAIGASAAAADLDPGLEIADRDLLAAHVAGDKHAFATLVRRHYDRLWYVALRTSSGPEDAADALQDALLAAHRNAGNFRGDSAVRTWLHSIVVNACLDRIRRNKVRVASSLDEMEGPAAEPVDHSTPYADFEMSHVIESALQTLPADQRAALVAVDIEGYSVAETAAMLGVAEGTIKSRCARARSRLAERLEFLRDPRNRN